MSLFDTLNADNFEFFAAKYYSNPQCASIEEFKDDLLRFKYLKKLFTRYDTRGDLQARLILNHITILYNVFDMDACTAMLFHKTPMNSWGQLATFLDFLNYLPDMEIGLDNRIRNELERI